MSGTGMLLNQVSLSARSIPESIVFHGLLGLRLTSGSPHHARFKCQDGEALLSLHRHKGIPSADQA